jgi:hypothetical protein
MQPTSLAVTAAAGAASPLHPPRQPSRSRLIRGPLDVGLGVGVSEIEKTQVAGAIDQLLEAGVGPKAARFALGCLGGLIPFAGGAIGAAAGAWSEAESDRFKEVLATWLKLQEDELREIGITLVEVMTRLDHEDETVRERIESPEYLRLVKRCFRDWSAAESEEKRILIRNLLVNAASCRVSADDIVSAFIEWIERYSEAHVAIIREIYRSDRITRAGIWENIGGADVTESSAEADHFKLLIRDLSTGQVIRQYRHIDSHGRLLKTQGRKTASRHTITSAFDREKEYVLTELGRQFVHYTMTDLVRKLEDKTADV